MLRVTLPWRGVATRKEDLEDTRSRYELFFSTRRPGFLPINYKLLVCSRVEETRKKLSISGSIANVNGAQQRVHEFVQND